MMVNISPYVTIRSDFALRMSNNKEFRVEAGFHTLFNFFFQH